MKPYGFRPRAWDFDGADKPVAVVDKKRARTEGRRSVHDAMLLMLALDERPDVITALAAAVGLPEHVIWPRELDSAPESDESVKTQEKS